jgi:hypothetical protein
MSASTSTVAPSAASSRRPGRWPRLLKEPLLHFVLLGGALFAIDHVVANRADDPRVIVVGSDVTQEARQLFQSSRGRAPNDAELAALHATWLDNEVLYREGLALQVDRGDSAIRERVIFKALSVVNANLKQPPIDGAEIRAWFEANRVRYDEPARYDFQEAVLAGEASEANVRAFVQALNRGTPGDVDAGLRVFRGRPLDNLVQSYGAEFVKALAESPPGEWRAQPTRDGWRAIRLDAATPARPADFDVLQGVVLHDWIDAKMAEQRTAAVRALAKKYNVQYAAAR